MIIILKKINMELPAVGVFMPIYDQTLAHIWLLIDYDSIG